jgi:hypothetical protein
MVDGRIFLWAVPRRLSRSKCAGEQRAVAEHDPHDVCRLEVDVVPRQVPLAVGALPARFRLPERDAFGFRGAQRERQTSPRCAKTWRW